MAIGADWCKRDVSSTSTHYEPDLSRACRTGRGNREDQAAHAQRRATPVVGYLYSGSAAEFARVAPAFQQGLREAGFVDGQDVKVEFRLGEELIGCQLWQRN